MANVQTTGMAEGIYFNLSDDVYHNDPALSHSGMTKLLISWPDYWVGSCHNPERKKLKVTEAMEFGKRSGMLLTQPQVFHKTYNTHGRTSPTAKGQWLSSVEWQRLNESVEAITDVEIGAKHFKDGYAEVAVFWRDPTTNIMLRAKFDFLRTFGVIDVKRIKAMDDWTIGNAVRDQGLDIQNYLYLEGMKAARQMLLDKGLTGIVEFAKENNVDSVWLIEFANDPDLLFRFLFQRSTPPYIWKFKELDEDLVVEGANAMFEAMKRYKEGSKLYGFGKPPMGENKVETISSFVVPRRRYQYEN